MVNGINPNAVISAYSNSQGISGGTSDVGNVGVKGFAQNDPIAHDGQASFADFLEQSAQGAMDTLKHGETMSGQAVTGEADLVDVVQAVNAAEVTLKTVTAVRDKVILAYQDIMRMPI